MTVYGILEGEKRERKFLEFLQETYLNQQMISFSPAPIHGGNPNFLILEAIKRVFNYDRVFVWFDEDKEISDETRSYLMKHWKIDDADSKNFMQCSLGELQNRFNQENRKPILIVSQPVSVESLIVMTLGKRVKHEKYDSLRREEQLASLKNTLKEIFGRQDEFEYYQQHLSREILEERRKKIPELNILISMLEA